MRVAEKLEMGLFGLEAEFSFIHDCAKHLEFDGSTRVQLLGVAEKLIELADKIINAAKGGIDQSVSH